MASYVDALTITEHSQTIDPSPRLNKMVPLPEDDMAET
jgi:hypothetical protein